MKKIYPKTKISTHKFLKLFFIFFCLITMIFITIWIGFENVYMNLWNVIPILVFPCMVLIVVSINVYRSTYHVELCDFNFEDNCISLTYDDNIIWELTNFCDFFIITNKKTFSIAINSDIFQVKTFKLFAYSSQFIGYISKQSKINTYAFRNIIFNISEEDKNYVVKYLEERGAKQIN